ncbi:MAG: single-stranded-DNA-specific exonuclease RecJ [Candidatus Andersenbacteria bacterium RIFCSPHIGHO2_02_FULL_45_11]|nr:MAG: single-stranded-DNA-specific exonuclease RecJ [Candidatus Andersenbacteria bacterium RIFCSPHIGHO2_01_FULL_46_36]OGY34238.1 MAG: single-stranded-DNA-specific exonuclease RecJ [Candidatus Andersenbacteria bacterium RIFCSPHIGHO2_02_FULL_45_11]
MNQLTWNIRGGETGEIGDQDKLLEVLLSTRNVSADARESFFAPSYADTIHNPHDLYDMDRAAERVMRAVKNKERILVYGDYDADGICSTAIMVSVLSDIGANVIPFLPHRYDDGYGVSGAALTRMQAEFDLLITVDCGVSNAAEIAALKDAGKDAIIVDHHEIPKVLPEAFAILHPRHPKGSYGWGHLCGAGTAWKFAQALLRHPDSPYTKDPDREKWLLDLAMIGTVADVMPLLGENRAIVHFGKQVLPITRRLGLAALFQESRINPTSFSAEDIAFRIVPLLNAAGRIGHPQSALNALLASTAEEARVAVKALVSLNTQRRAVSKSIVDDAMAQVDPSLPFVFVANTDWPAGIVGLVAGRLATTFAKPAFVVGGVPNATHGVGSARSGGGASVLQALETVRTHTMKLGGHSGAAGFSVMPENFKKMQEGLHEYFIARQSLGDGGSEPMHHADAHISQYLVSWEVAHMLDKFEPFGEANPRPVFMIKGLRVFEMRTVGKQNDHIKAKMLVGDREIDAIGFGLGEKAKKLPETVDVLASIGVNAFRGRESLELRLVDVVAAQ